MVATARVPVLRARHIESCRTVDITVNNRHAIANTCLLRSYLLPPLSNPPCPPYPASHTYNAQSRSVWLVSQRTAELVCTVRAWARLHQLRLSSYCTTLVVLAYLQVWAACSNDYLFFIKPLPKSKHDYCTDAFPFCFNSARRPWDCHALVINLPRPRPCTIL